jgi:hypothetical protein
MEFTTNLELHSQTTRLVEGASRGERRRPDTGFSPSLTSCSKGLGPGLPPKHPLQITTRTPGGPDFKFELLPLHSPLLRQSLLVSFPPLIDMLKFSGYPHLIRGQPCVRFVPGGRRPGARARVLLRSGPGDGAHEFRARPRAGPITKRGLRVEMALEQVCPPECQGAQCAFKDSMIH